MQDSTRPAGDNSPSSLQHTFRSQSLSGFGRYMLPWIIDNSTSVHLHQRHRSKTQGCSRSLNKFVTNPSIYSLTYLNLGTEITSIGQSGTLQAPTLPFSDSLCCISWAARDGYRLLALMGHGLSQSTLTAGRKRSGRGAGVFEAKPDHR